MTLENIFGEKQKRLGKTFDEQYTLITYMYYYLGETPSLPRILADIQEGYLTIMLGHDQKFYFHYLDEAEAKEAAISMDGYIISGTDFVKYINFNKNEAKHEA